MMPLCRVFIILACLCALLLLPACSGGDKEQMLRQLEELERQNRADSVMRNDSLAERLAEYFDHHGTPNERMRAHYILGRTYADMGEAPAAVNAYLDAADAADTTAADCDYRTLSRVYGQMSSVLYKQNLMEDYIKACDEAISCAWRAKDTLQALNVKAYKIAGYHRLKQYDTVITAFDSLFDELERQFGIWMAAKYITIPISALLAKNQLEKCKYYFDVAERYSGYFDSVKNVEKGREVYYNYKGCYFLNTQQYDSAEHCFRKELSEGLDVTNQSMASRGLSLLYSETHRLDSAVKYALYSYEMNDSVYAQMATEAVSQARASYNYQRNKALAEKERHRADTEKTKKEHLLLVLFLVVLAGCSLGLYLIRKRRYAVESYQRKVRELAHTTRTLQDLTEQKAVFEALAKEEIIQKSLELNSIQRQNEKLALQIQGANEVLAQLRKELTTRYDGPVLSSEETESRLEGSPVYQRIHDRARAGKALTGIEWKSIEQLLKEVLPNFYNLISSRQSSLRQDGRRLCFLLRLHVGLKEAGALMGISQPQVSKLSKSILQRVFQEEGSGKELAKRLDDII